MHAPLLGPTSWSWAAEELTRHRIDVVVPDLHRITQGPLPQDFTDALGRVIREHDAVVLVGHSGAGPLLPLAAATCDLMSVRYVFVDAAIPPPGSVLPTSADFRQQLEALVDADGLLPPWHTWWGRDGMTWLVPDPDRRRRVTADVPRLPLSYFDAEVIAPSGWERAAGGFVLLSETYRSFARTAVSYGWPLVEVSGTHLELVNDPKTVAQAIISALDGET